MKLIHLNPVFIDTAKIAARNKLITFPSQSTNRHLQQSAFSYSKTKPSSSSTTTSWGFTTTTTGEPLPLPFDGSIPWDHWLFLFDTCANMNLWRDPVKLSQLLVLSLRGPALNMCLTLPKEIRGDYPALRAALTGALQPDDTLEELKEKLQRRRGSQETLKELQVNVCKMVKEVYPEMEDKDLEEHARVVFLNGIKGSSYGEKTIDNQPKTLEEAVQMAMFFEQREIARNEYQIYNFMDSIFQ